MEKEDKGLNIKSQVSFFIILGIVLVSLILIYFALRTNVFNVKESVDPNVAPIYSYVDNCIKQTGESAIKYIGQTGGYFSSPESSTDNHIAYYLYNKQNLIPSKEIIEKELSDYMTQMLFFCTNNFENFPDFEIKQGKINTNAKIIDGKVIFSVDYPLSISKGNNNYNLKKFENKINVRLDIIYETAYSIMQEQMKHKEDICLNCIQELANVNDLYIDMFDYKEKVVVFIITDPESKINNRDYEFQFANSY